MEPSVYIISDAPVAYKENRARTMNDRRSHFFASLKFISFISFTIWLF